jgi:hypothetical protein
VTDIVENDIDRLTEETTQRIIDARVVTGTATRERNVLAKLS